MIKADLESFIFLKIKTYLVNNYSFTAHHSLTINQYIFFS